MGTTALTPNPVVQPQITQSYRDSACSHPQLGFPEEKRHGGGKLSPLVFRRQLGVSVGATAAATWV